ncbi:type II toxin-antitoxin system RelE/ParE family toxin [Caulobacter hibisci]|uniref:Type II toxin-antitoxin system RelE/ParE family toxin n=1 Tax=Caulobacter hibisci TaxID=2035993 RepID=A0ABS0T0P4_9CAUL|nr:type II toxin-antitoxin system RelE/ParE family toxin [Caulobacter hibisci]MBI1685451.1 type II toxin-antitoxin system RelE/ParE family toxin [Caulobacter hibisci]
MSQAAFSPLARLDLIEAEAWIRADRPSAAVGFRRAVLKAAGLVFDQPNCGVERLEIAAAPHRLLVVHGFPYLFVYNAERRPPLIVRVLHGARDLPSLLSSL